MLKSTYTLSDANHNLEVARKNFRADDFYSVVELHMCLCYSTEAELFEEMNQIVEEYNIDSFDFQPFPDISAYRWNMEQVIINRDSKEKDMAGASIRVVEHIQDMLYKNFYLFEEAVKK